ncbi:hypothetical protein [Azorhizobium doebereinerae]|uniref:hypothetical protein n=1 Tax=Azorhizobium doebereinerae TaxID=281091 RepID=UPI0003F67C7D|nr:hypothetical protein [Azorhizobium doebereinerae]
MTRDPRTLDQNPLVVDPANVDAVLHDRPSPSRPPLKAPLAENDAEYDDAAAMKDRRPPDVRVPPASRRG